MGIMKTPLQNAVQKTLDATLAAAAVSMTLNEDVSALFSSVSADNPAVCVVDRVDTNSTPTPIKREYIKFTGVSGASLTGLTRNADASGTDQEHSVGAVVEFIPDVLFAKSILDTFDVEHDVDGTHDTTKVVDLATAQTLTNKTLTSPVITTPQINDTTADHQYITAVSELTADRTVTLPLLTANDTFVFRNHSNVAINFNAPEGFLINGKIVPSVASNDLTVAIKGLDGNDPSATNPVYCRIGDTVRSITAALSVTKADATNWCNAGSAELATKEIDYFVYLGYNATDGVVVGFSRIPYATLYSNFSATAANEKYCGISTITNAAAGDTYTNIGRFAATLSAGAGYTWTVPTFTSANLVQRPIYETRWLVYLPTYSCSGSMTYNATSTLKYKVRQDTVEISGNDYISGTIGGTPSNTLIITPPFAALVKDHLAGIGIHCLYDNSANTAGITAYLPDTTHVGFCRYNVANFTAGSVILWVRGSYPLAV